MSEPNRTQPNLPACLPRTRAFFFFSFFFCFVFLPPAGRERKNSFFCTAGETWSYTYSVECVCVCVTGISGRLENARLDAVHLACTHKKARHQSTTIVQRASAYTTPCSIISPCPLLFLFPCLLPCPVLSCPALSCHVRFCLLPGVPPTRSSVAARTPRSRPTARPPPWTPGSRSAGAGGRPGRRGARS